MARRPRQDDPGSWHHLINRGLSKRPLFERREDIRYFLSRLARQVRAGRIEVHAYCLLTTHFHILARSPVGELSEALRRVQNDHSRRFNREHRRDGPLIRGRYFSRPVDSLRYRRVLVGYIDANPIRAGMARLVGEYEHCSARHFANGRFPRWLDRSWVLSEAAAAARNGGDTWSGYLAAFHGGEATAGRGSDALVEDRIRSRAAEDPLADLVSTQPAHVRAWFERKSALADGHQPGLPVCTVQTLRAVFEETLARRGGWFVRDDDRYRRGEELAWIGLLRTLCGLTWEGMAREASGSSSRLARLGGKHQRLFESDTQHRDRTHELAREALTRTYID